MNNLGQCKQTFKIYYFSYLLIQQVFNNMCQAQIFAGDIVMSKTDMIWSKLCVSLNNGMISPWLIKVDCKEQMYTLYILFL